MKSRELNKQFVVLKFFSIVFVVLGHMEVGYLQFNYITYYSFHMPLFMFISGYFLKNSVSVEYWVKKFKKLLIPFLLWNFIYLCIQTFLNTRGYALGNSLSLYNIFVFPFKYAQPNGFNISSWFIVTLTGVFIVDTIMRKFARCFQYKEGLLLLIYFLGSVISLYLRIEAHVPEDWINLLKIFYMLPYFQLGRIYKLYLEDKINISVWKILFGIWVIFYGLNLNFHNLDYGVYSLVLPFNRKIYIFLTYVTAILGILFWVKLSELLVPILGDSKIVRLVAKSSYSIMMHHLFVVFLIQYGLYFLFKENAMFQDFDYERFKSTVYYVYDFQKDIRLVYAISSIAIITYSTTLFKKITNMIGTPTIGG